MKIEDLFKKGVTPKSVIMKGDEVWAKAGDKLDVQAVYEESMSVVRWDGEKLTVSLEEIDIWQPPKTLFDDTEIKSTWGELKKAMLSAELCDNTEFWHRDALFGDSLAKFRVIEIAKGKKAIIIY